jgi:hypothetical protein
MKISMIAARLPKIALDMEAAAAKHDYDWPEEMVLPFLVSSFTDDNAVKSLSRPERHTPSDN